MGKLLPLTFFRVFFRLAWPCFLRVNTLRTVLPVFFSSSFRFDSLFPRCARLTCLFCVGRCSAAPNAVRSGSRENGFPRGNLVSRRIPPRLSLRAATLWGKRAPDGTESVRGVPLVGDVSRALGGGLKFSGTRSLLTDRERPRAGFIGRAHYAGLCHLNSLTSLP